METLAALLLLITCVSAFLMLGAPRPASGPRHAFLWDGRLRDLGSLGGNFSRGQAINRLGQVAGMSTLTADDDDLIHAVVWDASGMRDLGTLPGLPWVSATGINDAGVVVGNVRDGGPAQAAGLLPGDVYVPAFPAYAMMAGKPWHAHYVALCDLVGLAPGMRVEFARQLASRRFEAVVPPNGHPRSLPAPSPRWGNSHPRLRNRANVSLPDKVRRLAALTNGTVRPNAKCCAGLCKASSPARRALCQSPIAWQSPVPNPSIPRPS